MQPNTKAKRGLINDDVTTAANFIKSDEARITGAHIIQDATGALVIPPIRKGSIIKVFTRASVLEKQQFVVVGNNAEVIVANKRYTVGMQFPKDRLTGSTNSIRKFATDAPATLSGTAATDRSNIYTSLATKINAYVPNYTKARLAVHFNFRGAATVTTAGFAAGAIWYVGANLASATWIGFVARATGALAVATNQNVLLVTLSGTFPTAPTTDVFRSAADNAVQSVADAGSTYTQAQGLVIYDEAGYFPTKERIGRGGAPIIFSSGFGINPTILQAHAYGSGVGTEMISRLPEFNITKQKMTLGSYENQYVNAPVAGNFYTEYTILVKGDGIPNAMSGATSDKPIEHTLFVKESTQGTAMAAFKSAIEALT